MPERPALPAAGQAGSPPGSPAPQGLRRPGARAGRGKEMEARVLRPSMQAPLARRVISAEPPAAKTCVAERIWHPLPERDAIAG
jgi:hypothetical protein